MTTAASTSQVLVQPIFAEPQVSTSHQVSGAPEVRTSNEFAWATDALSPGDKQNLAGYLATVVVALAGYLPPVLEEGDEEDVMLASVAKKVRRVMDEAAAKTTEDSLALQGEMQRWIQWVHRPEPPSLNEPGILYDLGSLVMMVRLTQLKASLVPKICFKVFSSCCVLALLMMQY